MFKTLLNKIPRTATAPFCPSEVSGTVIIPEGLSFWGKLFKFAGDRTIVRERSADAAMDMLRRRLLEQSGS